MNGILELAHEFEALERELADAGKLKVERAYLRGVTDARRKDRDEAEKFLAALDPLGERVRVDWR